MRARYLGLVIGCALGLGCHRSVVDLDGRAVDPLGSSSLTALIFVSPGCPIANRYVPEVRRIAERFGASVRFFVVYPDASAPEARAHVAEYALGLTALRDPARSLVHRAGVTVTPEAALFVGRTLVWHGRIDDRYGDIAHERPAATRHDLEEALTALVAGRDPPPASPAVGCLITSP